MTTSTSTKTTPKTKKQPWEQVTKFTSLAVANRYADGCIKLHLVILGDDGYFWVGTPRITEQLVKLGYEYAE